jgi:hypothetical protein
MGLLTKPIDFALLRQEIDARLDQAAYRLALVHLDRHGNDHPAAIMNPRERLKC